MRERYLDLQTQGGPKKHSSVALVSRAERKSANKQNHKSKSNSESHSSKKKDVSGVVFQVWGEGSLEEGLPGSRDRPSTQTGKSEDDEDENGEKSGCSLKSA